MVGGVRIGVQQAQEYTAAISGFLPHLPPRRGFRGVVAAGGIGDVDAAADQAGHHLADSVPILPHEDKPEIARQRDDVDPIRIFDDVERRNFRAIDSQATIAPDLQPFVLECDLARNNLPWQHGVRSVFTHVRFPPPKLSESNEKQ